MLQQGAARSFVSGACGITGARADCVNTDRRARGRNRRGNALPLPAGRTAPQGTDFTLGAGAHTLHLKQHEGSVS